VVWEESCVRSKVYAQLREQPFWLTRLPNGWLIRYVHANGASMFFIVVYAHICRGLYYGSYMNPRELLWCSGVILLLLMMGTAFTGYVLPWGQMSFWGATVITNMVTAIPVAGTPIVQWLWGGYTVANPTLNRFYSIHFVLPFLIAGVSLIHLALLHKVGSNNPIGSDTGVDDVPFYPYFFSKDLFALSCFLFFFSIFIFYFPNVLNHPDNCIPADPLQTPAHVVPEWYFLPFYAILRSIPQCEYAPLVSVQELYTILVDKLSVIHPIGAESDKLSIMSSETRLGNLESQPYGGQRSLTRCYNSYISNTCVDVKVVECAVIKVLNMYVK
jgi:quinol-cytochrome oxidoreductase complex cytochrome b subunit